MTRMLILPTTDERAFGRHVEHDPRSLDYKDRGAPRAMVSAHHERHVPILDQGQLGSCTANAAMSALGTSPNYEMLPAATVLDEAFAVKVYSLATGLDPFPGTYPPDDTGSSGNAVAKALRSLHIVKGWTWSFTLNATLRRLCDRPVMIGVPWRETMMTPDSSGLLNVSGPVAGGHEVCLDEIDVERQEVWIANSWGASWGIEGRARLSFKDLGTLLADHGDATILTL